MEEPEQEPDKSTSIKKVIHSSPISTSSNNASPHSESDVVLSQCQWPSISTINTKSSIESSTCNSPSLISPPSSAFVSALQSPYISPRATLPPPTPTPPLPLPPPSPSPPGSLSVSCRSGSYSDDVPSTSYTPPTDEQFDFSDPPASADQKQLRYVSCEIAAPRISFSFPVPRISLTKASSVSPSCTTKLRSCDVYIGFHGQQNPNLLRFCKWLKSELELQGIACFVADRAKYSDTQSHEIADRIICAATFGVVVVTNSSFLNHFSLEEIVFFSQKKNLIPLLFDTDSVEIAGLVAHDSDDKESSDAIQGLLKSHEYKLEANECNWRSCISSAVGILRIKLGRKSVSKIEIQDTDELPFPRNKFFVGREKEISEIENSFFGCGESIEHEVSKTISKGGSGGVSEGFADEESDIVRTRGERFISLEMRKSKEPTLEAWIEPVIGKSPSKRSKHKKSKSGHHKNINSVICISGISGIGKTELSLEFAYKYAQRYKRVLWVGGEARYFRQNILNLSVNLGLDVSAEAEKERGRVRSFEEQEYEAFQRVKRELFRDVPYLLVIDNLETEKEWWEGKDLFDLIPRNTGASHVIITTRLPKVMNIDAMQLPPLPPSDAMLLIKGRRKNYPADELEYLRKFDERLEHSSFGMWVAGSLLSELAILPSVLFEAVNRICLENDSPHLSLSAMDEQFCKNNHFLIKLMEFCSSVLEQTSKKKNILASRMLLAGAWFAPAPISANLLAVAAKNITSPENRFKHWTKCLGKALCCCSCCCSSHIRKSEVDSAFLLVKLGLAKRTTRKTGCWIQFHPITQLFAKRKGGLQAAKATVQGLRKIGNPVAHSDHLWASAFLVFGFKCEPPFVQMKAVDMALFIKRTALPLAVHTFTTFSRCTSSLELLKVCTNVLEDVEKSFVSQIQDWHHGSLCWKKKIQSNQRVDEYVWEDVTLLKATLLETRAKLLLRGGYFDSGEELCRTCISIRTVMLGHNHAQTLAAQETLTRLVRYRSKM